MLQKKLLLFLCILGFVNSAKVETNCGMEFEGNPHSQIIFGTSLTEFEHPWFCDFDVQFDDLQSHCSAVMISSEYLMTAAHCFDSSKLPQHERFISLRCGATGNMINVTAIKVIKHSVFADTDMHDLALIRIKEIRYTNYLRPICLISREKILENSSVTAIGSGLEYFALSGKAQKAEITVRSVERCSELYGGWARSKDNVLCAGKAITGLREGDSGGPLTAFFQGRHYLIGITTAKKIDKFLLPDAATLWQSGNPVLFSRIAPECNGFIEENSNVKCLNNAVPIETSESKDIPCGEVSESRQRHFSTYSNSNGSEKSSLHPWLCKLMDKNRNAFCGGTLISFRQLLTTKSCLDNQSTSEVIIKCGLFFQTTSKIAKIRKPEENKAFPSDLAVIEFEREINFDGNVGVACLTQDNHLDGTNSQIMVINDDFANTSLPTATSCQTKKSSKNSTVISCNQKTNTLKGGPLLSKINGKWHVVGVTSTETKDNQSLNFTKVSNFCDFITLRGNVKCSNKNTSTINMPIAFLYFLIFSLYI